MSEERLEPEDRKGAANATAGEGDTRATTPFEKPFFMPIVLFTLMLWFGYDGWFNEEIESIMFNRVVFGVLVVMTIYTTWQDVQFVRKSKK